MRVGIFGGSFDPPHTGHLLMATDAVEALGLDYLQVVPAGIQPLKTPGRTPADHRLAMTRLCFQGVPRVEVDPIEIQRGGLSFSVDTVEAYRRQWPDAVLHFLLGEDAVAGLTAWREPRRLLSLVTLVVLAREGSSSRMAPSLLPPELASEFPPPQRLATRRVDVSSTEVRARVGRGQSIRGFVPDAVAAYIASTGLYLQEPAAPASLAPA